MGFRTMGVVLGLGAVALASPALADGMPPDELRHRADGRSASAHSARHGGWGPRHRPVRQHMGAVAIEAASYGPPPAVTHAPAGPVLVVYSEPYLPRGVLYNVPPPPVWAIRAAWGIRALN